MKQSTTNLITRICLMISAIALLLTFVHDLALANSKVIDTPVSLVSTTQSPQPDEVSDPNTASAQTLSRPILSAAALGAAVGASGYAQALQARAWLDPVPEIAYPEEIQYTVTKPISLIKQSTLWGVSPRLLLALNPGFSEGSQLSPGLKLTVFKRTAWSPQPVSIGPTNRGRIQNGRMMPEGDENSGHFLRDERQRSFATANTINALVSGFAAYATRFPEAPRVNVGDFSKRRGGKIKPHASHQSGRDVDIGFIHVGTPRNPQHFTRATSTNVDVEKTWFMLKSIIASGEVKSIYVDKTVQKQLYNFAKNELNDAQLEAIFSIPKREHSSSALIQHWPGHRNHFHIRFTCPENNPRCRK